MTKESETKYRIHNWANYNKALVQRGNITLWVCEESIKKCHDSSKGNGKSSSTKSQNAVLRKNSI